MGCILVSTGLCWCILVVCSLQVIMPNTACDGGTVSRLYQLVNDQFPSTNLVTVQRKYFNEAKGASPITPLLDCV